MLTNNQVEIIRKYVDRHYFDVERLIEYLSIHSTVGPEVFKTICYRQPRRYSNRPTRFNYLYEEGFGFKPISTEQFVRRIPFYFYLPDREVHSMDLIDLIDSYHDLYLSRVPLAEVRNRYDSSKVDWEPMYECLERMHYDFKLDVADIMSYICTQSSNARRYDLFEGWYKYLDLLFENNISDELMPKNLLYSYNVLLTSLGKEPIYYAADFIGFDEIYTRKGNQIEISGEFPVNPDTNEVEMRWVLVWVEGHEGIRTILPQKRGRHDNTLSVTISIKLGRKTRIYLPSCSDVDDWVYWEDDKNIWKPIYIGPQAMVYDDTAIKRLREERKMTQKDVAEIIDVKLRTYQNWETGQSKPDTLDLIKLMNLFDIDSVQELIKNDPIIDPNFEKFKTGCEISYFAPIEK